MLNRITLANFSSERSRSQQNI